MYVATVVDIPEIPDKLLKQAEEELLKTGYEIFHSDGLFTAREKQTEGNSLIVLHDDGSQPIPYHMYWPEALQGTDARPAFVYFRSRKGWTTRGNRRAFILFLPMSARPDGMDYFLPDGTVRGLRHHDRIEGTREYLRNQGDLFSQPGTNSLEQFYHSELVIIPENVVLYGLLPNESKAYTELSL